MQEALAHYAGNTPGTSKLAFFDTTSGFTARELVPGFDCPYYATFTGSYCLFESQNDFPIQRHTEEHIQVTKNMAFLIRHVATIANYDYQTTYEFYLDGSIQILIRASGYINSSGCENKTTDPEYGFHIRNGVSGGMHDRVLNWKLDLDVYGTANSLAKTEFVPVSTTYP